MWGSYLRKSAYSAGETIRNSKIVIRNCFPDFIAKKKRLTSLETRHLKVGINLLFTDYTFCVHDLTAFGTPTTSTIPDYSGLMGLTSLFSGIMWGSYLRKSAYSAGDT